MSPIRARLSVKFMIGVTAVLVAVLSLNLLWEVQEQKVQVFDDLHEQAKTMATQIIAMREFMARSQHRINHDSKGNFEFKGLNPAAVGRGVGEIFADMSNYRFKQTRLQVRNETNQPDEFEIKALQRFAADPALKEIMGRTSNGQEATFRYMVPLIAEKSCLQCHGEPKGAIDIAGYTKEGLKEGELAGALSIYIPMERFEQRIVTNTKRRAMTIVAFAGLSLVLIGVLTHQLVTRPLTILAGLARRIGRGRWRIEERESKPLKVHQEISLLVDAMTTMSNHLQDLYQGLESKVEQRTAELKEANDRLIRAHGALARFNQTQSEFYTTMTHEFRTPLTAIIGFTQLLLQSSDQSLSQAQREYLTDVLESAQRLLQLVNDLLDANRLEAGQLRLNQQAVDLGDVVREVISSLRPLAQQKEITLAVDLPADLPLVLADDLRLVQILLNLVGNAIKFTHAGGRVTVRAKAEGDVVHVMVQDNGPGIDPEDQQVIFELFRRASKTERVGGSGLGLALAKRLVELHGGVIWVESETGQGATFHFTLPIHRNQPAGCDGPIKGGDSA
ncbi:MAG: ATP-binding protein [Bacillota bacterium]